MAVQIPEKTKAKPSAATTIAAAVAATMTLQLVRIERLQRVNGPTFERTKAYTFPEAVALNLLAEREEDTGLPVWKVYKQSAKAEVESTVDAPEVIDATVVVVAGTDEPLATVAVAESGPKAIEIGTEEDLKDLGLPGNDDDVTTV